MKLVKEHSKTIIESNDESTLMMTILMRTSIMSMHHLPMLRSSALEGEKIVIPEIEALKDNPTPSSDIVTKSSSTSLNLFLEETNTFDNSLTESFCFDLEKNSSGSTTTRSDYSLPDYEAFYSDDDHIKEKSSGSTTTHANFSQYEFYHLWAFNQSFPPADRMILS
ncbi:hypothetical protein Tco_1547958 [Tanacetum coccineum]